MDNDLKLITESFQKACTELNLDSKTQASIVDLSVFDNGTSETKVNTAKQKCLKLIELYTALRTLLGTDKKATWFLLNNVNTQLDGKPIELISSSEGLEKVTNYYTSMTKSLQ